MTEFTTIAAACEQSLTEKRSEFIAQLFPVQTAQAALAAADAVRAKHHKARHHVWAFRIRAGGLSRYSDDGEPQGTGGVPVLSVLEKAGLTDVCCVVTRYFGGVLLGASGLARAYSSAAAQAVQSAEMLHYCEAYRIRYAIDYGSYGKVSYLLPEFDTVDAGSDFGEKVTLLFDIKTNLLSALEARLTEAFNGKPALEQLDTHFVSFPKAAP
ncbi:MAG: YigZ family protein [Oscillospiraceae bacterium]|nr:YigZ family protein [Oscillospiraceae bacterium]